MKWRREIVTAAALSLMLALSSCGSSSSSGGGGNGPACELVTNEGCENNQVCAETTSGEVACVAPLQLQGSVVDLETNSVVEGARVVALDANGAPISNVATTDVNGEYELLIDAERTNNGAPAEKITLRADASGYQTFPGGVRPPFPVDLSQATVQDGVYVLDNTLTQLGLIALPEGAGTGVLEGKIEVPEGKSGVLVVAVDNGNACPAQSYFGDCTGFADRSGEYKIFNLPADNYSVKGYVGDYNYNSQSVNLPNGQTKTLSDLTVSDQNTATLNGKINIVNPGLGQATSVFLVLESTFQQVESTIVNNIPVLTRGTLPPGLRVDNVTGDFTISGVPAGDYVILAAYEDDFLVRDPDTCIAGTDLIFQSFAKGDTVDLENPFKITGSIDNLDPDNGAAILVDQPEFSWDADSSAKHYVVTVFDSFGNINMDATFEAQGGVDPSLVYDGPALENGMYYQFRVISLREKGNDLCEISQSENLKGVFQKQ